MNILFNWLEEQGVTKVIQYIYSIIKIIRIIVPIGLIIMTSFDIIKKVINPEDKDGQKKIMIRLIAAIIVFFIPLFIRFVFKIADIDIENINTVDTETINNTYVSSLTSLNIINCPNVSRSYNSGDYITLDTDIPSLYNGEIKWIPRADHNVFKIISSSNQRSITLEVIDKPDHCITDVSVKAGGIESNCVIVVKGC